MGAEAAAVAPEAVDLTARRFRLSDEQVRELCASATPDDLRAVINRLIADKQSIEQQLANTKAQIADVRSDYLDDGVHPVEAQMRAVATTDAGWRARASAAVRVRDQQIRTLRQRAADLARAGNVPMSRAGVPQVRKAVPFPFGDADRTLGDFASDVQEWIDEGWHPISTIPHREGVVLIMRKDGGA